MGRRTLTTNDGETSDCVTNYVEARYDVRNDAANNDCEKQNMQ